METDMEFDIETRLERLEIGLTGTIEALRAAGLSKPLIDALVFAWRETPKGKAERTQISRAIGKFLLIGEDDVPPER
jgi:hypothetical protein